MKKLFNILYYIGLVILTSCSEDEVIQEIQNPENYTFTRGGASTVSFTEQVTFLAMLDELSVAMLDETNSEEVLQAMFDHNENITDFKDADLNASNVSIRNSVASSVDFFYLNTSESTTIKEQFDTWITEQTTDVFPNSSVTASAGFSGNVKSLDDNAISYVNNLGVEVGEVFNKGLIGGLIVDQILNNYLSSSILDTDDNIQDNDDTILVEGENYTAMEHAWDEAYGFLYGADNYLNIVINEADTDADFTGISDDVFNAFKLGRAAIVAKDYDEREDQAEIIKEKISLAIAIKIIKNFQSSKILLEEETIDYGTVFHQISEGIGFLYALQFTRQPQTTGSPAPYTTSESVTEYITRLLGVGNGLWESNTFNNLQLLSVSIENDLGYEVDELLNLLSN